MQSFLIVGENFEKSLNRAAEIAKDHGVSNIDFSVMEFEKALGIEDFRNIQKSIFLKPIKSPQKAVVINLQNGATLDAQSAMLKTLEEPPKQTILILLSRTTRELLETIISRCQVIELKDQEEIEKVDDEFEEILKASLGQKLVAAQNLSREKETALKFVKGAIFYVRAKMKKELGKGRDNENVKTIKQLQEAYYYLSETNVNPRMTLENLFLNLS